MKEKFGKIFKEYLFIGFGTFLIAFGLQFFLFPNKIASGGITGFALIINSIFHFPASIVVTIGNIILFSLAFMVISGQFGLKSIYASILLSVFLSIFEKFFHHFSFTNDLILATIFGSVFAAFGATIIFSYDASTGGTSIIGRIINKYFHLGIGKSSFIADAIVTVIAIFAFGVELALYGLLSIYISGYLTDKFIDGFNSRKQIMIASNNKTIIIEYILRDHDRKKFEEKKQFAENIAKKINEKYGENTVKVFLKDQYYNMGEIIKDHMYVVDIAREAMENLGIKPIIKPIRGGTDGSKISFMGLPTPNIFAGGENFHGKYEFVSLENMRKAVDTIIEIIKLNERK